MDNFAEQLVVKQLSGNEKAKRTLIRFGGIFLTVLIAAVSVLSIGAGLFPFVGLLLAAGTGYGTFFLVQNSYVEYEYTFTNGELDIDKIIAQKRRKSLVSVEVKSFTDFGKYSDDIEETDDMTVVFASENLASGEYYADFQHSEYGNTRLVFSPDERMLENINHFLSANVRKKLR